MKWLDELLAICRKDWDELSQEEKGLVLARVVRWVYLVLKG